MKLFSHINNSAWIPGINPQGFAKILEDTTLQNLKSEKTRKISIVLMPRPENLADLFLILLG